MTPPESSVAYNNTKPVTLKSLLIICSILLAGLLLISAGIGYWFFTETKARFLLREQSGWIKFPDSLNVKADINNAMQVQVDQSIPSQVPIKQAIDIPVPGIVNAEVSVDTQIPIALQVAVTDTLSIDQTVPIDTEVEVMVAGVAITLPIKGDVPLKADVPLNLTIPVNNDVPLKFDAPVALSLKEPIHAELDTLLSTQIPIQGILELPVTSQLEATLNFPPEPVEAGLYYLDMALPLSSIEFSTLDQEPSSSP
ncbi:MAG: hypothetical protein MI867_08865 [Pseudomonadales bacterium]|nr:hypothetical protein [Pseudomonadales bacterium]